MAKLIMSPTKIVYIASRVPQWNLNDDGWLFAGQGRNSLYRSLLEFDLSPMIDHMDVQKALLGIHSASRCQSHNVAVVTPYYIRSQWEEAEVTWNNQPPINQSIRGVPVRIMPGWNMLDITPVAQAWSNDADRNFGVMLKTRENSEDVVGFDIQRYQTMPALQLFYEECNRHSPQGCFYDVYPVSKHVGHSHWKQSCDHNMYTFFVRNMGNSEVELHVQISPDRGAVADENAQYKIMPHQSEAIVPQTFAFFTRLAFKTVEPHATSTIKVWFQPIVDRG